MKIEELQFSLPTEPIDEDNWDLEQWRKDSPMDYLKALYILFNYNNKDEIFQTIYKITRLYIPDVLYKYMSLSDDESLNSQKFETLAQKKIYLSDIKDFNDPFDGKAYYYNPDLLKKYEWLAPYGGRFIDDFTHFQKATSLSSNGINSMPMWAHYAGNHRGFCVSYKMEDNLSLNSSTFPVQYTDQRLDVTELMSQHAAKADVRKFVSPEDVHSFVLEDLSIVYMACWLCNIKHSSWSYEREFRCTMGATAKGMPYVEAKPKEIYVGMNCSPDHTSRLVEIAKAQQIPIFKMVFDECSSTYDLIARKIEI